MTETPKLNLSISKQLLLSEFGQIDQLLQDYRDHLVTAEKGEGWEHDAVRFLRHLQNQLYQAKVSLSSFELVSVLLKRMLDFTTLHDCPFNGHAFFD